MSEIKLNNTVIIDDNEIDQASYMLKAMSHPIRLKILCSLKDQEMPILKIMELVGSSQSNISQHVDILRTKNILKSRRSGNKILCRINDIRMLELISHMQSIFCNK